MRVFLRHPLSVPARRPRLRHGACCPSRALAAAGKRGVALDKAGGPEENQHLCSAKFGEAVVGNNGLDCGCCGSTPVEG